MNRNSQETLEVMAQAMIELLEEVRGLRKMVTCRPCRGQGLVSILEADGTAAEKVCSRCGGTGLAIGNSAKRS